MAMSSERFEMCQTELEGFLDELEHTLCSLETQAKSAASARKGADSSANHDLSRQQQLEKRLAAVARLSGKARDDLVEARKTLDDMEHEAKQAPREYRSEMLSKVRQGRASISKVHSRLRRLTEEAEREPTESSAAAAVMAAPTDEEMNRRQVQAGLSVLERTSQSIQRSTQVALESEAVGEEIVSDLAVQREGLERAQGRMQETEQELGRSNTVIRRLRCGILQNKAILVLIIIVELLILAALIYLKFIK